MTVGYGIQDKTRSSHAEEKIQEIFLEFGFFEEEQQTTNNMTYHDYFKETDKMKRTKYRKEFGDWIQEKRARNRRSVLLENIELVEQDYLKKKANEGFTSKIHKPVPHVYNNRPTIANDEYSLEDTQMEAFTNREKIFPYYHNEYYLQAKGNLLPWHEVKAINGIIWKYEEAYLTQNRELCTYARKPMRNWGGGWYTYAIPTRGNCERCGANGPLGRRCHNGCTHIGLRYNNKDSFKDHILKWSKKQHFDEGEKVRSRRCIFKMMKTPGNKGVIDAEFYSEACFVNSSDEINRMILGYVGYQARGRVSPRLKRFYNNTPKLEQFLMRKENVVDLKEDDEEWKKVVELCEKKGYGHPTKLKAGAIHFPDWSTYKLDVDEYGKPTLQECVGRKRKICP